MERITKVLKTCSVAVVLLLVGIVIGWLCRPTSINGTAIVQKDTIIVRDSVVIEKPVYISKRVTDTIYVAVNDTLRVKDTLYVTLPKEVKTYANDDYYAEVSGYQPSLDYLEIYQKNVVISKTEIATEKKNGLAVGTELGWCVTPSIPIYLEYTRKLHRNVEFNAGVFHDLVLGETGFRVGVNANIGW